MFASVLVPVLLGLAHLDVVSGRRPQHLEQYDALLVALCEAKCWDLPAKNSCVKLCLLNGVEKPGTCPNNRPIKSPFASICMETCKKDSQCPGVSKCCTHSCGVTCQNPEDLSIVPDLPDVPTAIRITEGRRKRKVFIEWNPGNNPPPSNSVTFYVIQERHYIGRHFLESRFSKWTTCFRSVKSSQILRHFVKPGRWYQFRIASVNENGTRGFSDPSMSFTTSAVPRIPKAPQNVTVGPLFTRNGSLTAEVRWSNPASDLPIQKYKIFWSRRLHGTTALDSVLVNQQTVPKDGRKFTINDLQPNSLYFIQIQALVQFGKERLKGEKSGLVLNTTNYTNVTNDTNLSGSITSALVGNLRLQQIYWHQDQLRARISWNCAKSVKRYTVSWWSGPCDQNGDEFSHFKLAATTKACVFDLFDLLFSCKYRVSVRAVTPDGLKSLRESSVTFRTPSCSGFKSRYKLTCPRI